MTCRLVILDRDGVINHDSDAFIKEPEEWIPIAGSLHALAELSDAGFTVAVATNQSGIGRKLVSRTTLQAIHEKMGLAAIDAGGNIDRVLYCPHLPDDGCDCRKPRPGLLVQLARYYNVSLNDVPFIGDSLSDIEAATAAGARPILVLTGKGMQAAAELDDQGRVVETFADLGDAVTALIAESRDI